MKSVLAAALGAATSALPMSADAMTYGYQLNGSNLDVYANGSIEKDEAAHFAAWRENLPAETGNRPIASITLNSGGGRIHGAIELANALPKNVDTYVATKGECSSACVLVWAGGAKKFVGFGGTLGVHQAAEDGEPSSEGTLFTVNYLASRGAPAAVLGDLERTPPESIHWLNYEELCDWHVGLAFPENIIAARLRYVFWAIGLAIASNILFRSIALRLNKMRKALRPNAETP